MAAPTSGNYRIKSALLDDHRYVQNSSGTLRLELLDTGASNDQKFKITLTGDGTYTIQSLTAPDGSGIDATEPQDIGSDGVQALIVVPHTDLRWNIQQAFGSTNPYAFQIATSVGSPPKVWNRIDGDGRGRLKLVDQLGGPDPHNWWWIESV